MSANVPKPMSVNVRQCPLVSRSPMSANVPKSMSVISTSPKRTRTWADISGHDTPPSYPTNALGEWKLSDLNRNSSAYRDCRTWCCAAENNSHMIGIFSDVFTICRDSRGTKTVRPNSLCSTVRCSCSQPQFLAIRCVLFHYSCPISAPRMRLSFPLINVHIDFAAHL